MMPFQATWMDLEIIILSDLTQRNMISLMWKLKKMQRNEYASV